MAIFRCLQRIIRNPDSPKPRPYLTSLSLSSSCSSNANPNPPFFSPLSRNSFLSPPPHSRFLSPLSDLFLFQGPLFLSSTPWKLSQSATPLLVQSDVVLPRRIDALKLLRNVPKVEFPIKLGFRKTVNEKNESVAQVNEMKDGGGFVESFLNLPNFVSFSRLVSGPFLGWMIVNECYLPAFVGLVVSGATDWLDGYLARRMGITSVVGSYLDPLADKVLVGCVAIAMVEKNLLHPGLVGLVVLRDVMLVGGAVYKRASSLKWHWKSWHDFFNLDGTCPEKVEPLFISKVNTVFQLILVAGALLQPELGTPETQSYITYLSWLVASTTVASTAAYGVQHLRKKSISISKGQ